METNKQEKHFVYLLTILLFLVGVILIVLSYLIANDLFSSILRGLGTTLLTAGVIGFLYEYYIQRQHIHVQKYAQEQFFQHMEKMLDSDIGRAAEKLGIKRIYFSRREYDEGERLRLLFEAKNVSILAVAPGMPESFNTIETISKLLEKGVNFRFLICNPNKPFFTTLYRASQEGKPLPFAKELIEKRLGHLVKIRREHTGPGRIDVRIYDDPPGWYIHRIDDKIFAEPYLYGTPGTDVFMLELEKGICYEYFSRHFEEMWDKAVSVEEFAKKYNFS